MDIMDLRGQRYISAEQRFVLQTKTADCGCIEWIGTKSHNGYGVIMVNGKSIRAHRYSYERFVKPIPEGLFVLHKCDNPSCVNPEHLFLGTNQDNSDDKVSKGRQAKGDSFKNRSSARGESNGNSKITKEDAIAIFNDERPQRKIAKSYGVSQATIFHIKSLKTWRHING